MKKQSQFKNNIAFITSRKEVFSHQLQLVFVQWRQKFGN